MSEQRYTVCLKKAVARNPQVRLSAPVDLDLKPNEHIAIAGPNGAGKSLLVDMITGKNPLLSGSVVYDFRPSLSVNVYENIKYIAFRDTYGSADSNFYYQQRWNAHDQEEIPLVRDLLGLGNASEESDYLIDLFHFRQLLDKPVILLSSGELRSFQLVKALLSHPRILIIDNPFIGLDAPTRKLLTDLLGQLASLGTLQIILVVSVERDIPLFVTHVVPVAEKKVAEKMERTAYLQHHAVLSEKFSDDLTARIEGLPYTPVNDASDEIIRLHHVSIRYGERTILNDLDWIVHRGEHWALSGENGSGKSTLLSLVCADNPQSYACDISLFGRRRGSGESIWDIKRHIGYVSPEMHRAYCKNLPVLDIVASGFHDSIGLYHRPKKEDMEACRCWMDIFGISDLYNRPFLTLSSGEQRLCLLVRAFVKDPELLILDEPLHGLDSRHREQVRYIIEAVCRRKNKTLVMVTHYDEELPPCIDHHLHLVRQDR